ncbi:ABC transporter ATP-binding protein [SAR202 cluster bacterium AC-409-J13_OGT_754m]|nr:ABC transporter ATP-binding protein [SAR202 cluster bacterium AC-409-J13_OGT_754m]
MINNPILRCLNLNKTFKDSYAVTDITFEISEGEILAILGPSGCGKTTTLRLIAGFETPELGSIEIAGKLMSGPGTFIAPEKRNVGMVFQDYALFPHLSVIDNVGYGLKNTGQEEARLRMVLTMAGLVRLQNRMPNELSGGEQQRVALARALVRSPNILLLDEPFSNLDIKLRQQVRVEVKDILKNNGVSSLFVTHDQREAFEMGDRIIILNEGHIEQVGTAEDIYEHPNTTFVAQFVGIADFLPIYTTANTTQCALGSLYIKQNLTNMANVTLMIRPTDTSICPSDQGSGTIISRIYQGAFTLYRILLNTGDFVHSLVPSKQKLQIGTKVNLRLKSDHIPRCFEGDRAINIA